MNKFLPTHSELRHAFFTAIILIAIFFVLNIFRWTAHLPFSNDMGNMRGDMMMSGKMHMMGDGKMMSNDMKMGSMDDMMMDMSKNMDGKTGAELEKTFLKDMITHHEGAVDMAKKLLEGTKRPELTKMGQDIITVQSKEIEMMKGWLNTWYGGN
jgi:uncharacterized protein (DUF305 family)